ncbi:IS66 family insertion sequence element accessory protein TnpB, partial [Lysinibacillus sp. NPDC096212]|uniref:IS66 family insertion sequence element accessory protein TnpB n=1 Tax=Lysinibacillus sp. NPDC096212 TaxID=3364135 RepID=UPI003830E1F8
MILRARKTSILFVARPICEKAFGLATHIQDTFELDPYSDSIFLFSGTSKDRYKCLYFDGDGFAMLYKR